MWAYCTYRVVDKLATESIIYGPLLHHPYRDKRSQRRLSLWGPEQVLSVWPHLCLWTADSTVPTVLFDWNNLWFLEQGKIPIEIKNKQISFAQKGSANITNSKNEHKTISFPHSEGRDSDHKSHPSTVCFASPASASSWNSASLLAGSGFKK